MKNIFNIDSSALRVRTFTMAGQTLKVRVPLASEVDAMAQRVDSAPWEDVYKKLSNPFLENKESTENEKIQFTDDDIIVDGNSIKEMAKMSAKTNARILEMFRLLVPAVDFDMSQLTYEMIEDEYPFSIQLDLSKKIADVISPGYEEARKN